MSHSINLLAPMTTFAAAASKGILSPIEERLIEVYRLSQSGNDPMERAEQLTHMAEQLVGDKEWTAAATAYKAASMAWADIPGLDPLWGLNPRYLLPLECAAESLLKASRHREAADILDFLSRQYYLSSLKHPKDDILRNSHRILHDRGEEALEQSGQEQGKRATRTPALRIILDPLASISIQRNRKIRGLNIGYVEIPFQTILNGEIFAVNWKRRVWQLPVLGARLLFHREHDLAEVLPLRSVKRNRRQSDVLDVYELNMPGKTYSAYDLAREINFILSVHKLVATPGLKVLVPPQMWPNFYPLNSEGLNFLDTIAFCLRDWLNTGEMVRLILKSRDDMSVSRKVEVTFRKDNGSVAHDRKIIARQADSPLEPV